MPRDEIRHLLARLEQGVQDTPRTFGRQGGLIVGGSVVVAAIAAVRAIWFLVPGCLLFGVGIYALMRAAQRRTSPERAADVLAALRDAPERVTKIVHSTSSDSHRMFVTHWIVVSTAAGRLSVRAPDWRELLDALTRRCPSAAVERGPGE